MRWTFVVDGIPTKDRARADRGRRPHPTPRTQLFEQAVAGAAIEAGVRWADGSAYSVVVAIFAPNRRRRDGDNVDKAVLDGLQRAGRRVLPDDDLMHVPNRHTYLAAIDRARPRIEITIETVEVP